MTTDLVRIDINDLIGISEDDQIQVKKIATLYAKKQGITSKLTEGRKNIVRAGVNLGKLYLAYTKALPKVTPKTFEEIAKNLRDFSGLSRVKTYLSNTKKGTVILDNSGHKSRFISLWNLEPNVFANMNSLEQLELEIEDSETWFRLVELLLNPGSNFVKSQLMVNSSYRLELTTRWQVQKVFLTFVVAATLEIHLQALTLQQIMNFSMIVTDDYKNWKASLLNELKKFFLQDQIAERVWKHSAMQKIVNDLGREENVLPLNLTKKLVLTREDKNTSSKLIRLLEKCAGGITYTPRILLSLNKEEIKRGTSINTKEALNELLDRIHPVNVAKIIIRYPYLMMWLNKVNLLRVICIEPLLLPQLENLDVGLSTEVYDLLQHQYDLSDMLKMIWGIADLNNLTLEDISPTSNLAEWNLGSKPANMTELQINEVVIRLHQYISKSSVEELYHKIISLKQLDYQIDPTFLSERVLTCMFFFYSEDKLPKYIQTEMKTRWWYNYVSSPLIKKHFSCMVNK